MASATDAPSGVPSITSLYNVCIRSFYQLCDCLEDSDGEFCDQISIPALQEELGRFRVWAGNVGAHRSGRVSLDHKLRESFQIHSKVSELLGDLDESLQTSMSSPGGHQLADEKTKLLPLSPMRESHPMHYQIPPLIPSTTTTLFRALKMSSIRPQNFRSDSRT